MEMLLRRQKPPILHRWQWCPGGRQMMKTTPTRKICQMKYIASFVCAKSSIIDIYWSPPTLKTWSIPRSTPPALVRAAFVVPELANRVFESFLAHQRSLSLYDIFSNFLRLARWLAVWTAMISSSVASRASLMKSASAMIPSARSRSKMALVLCGLSCWAPNSSPPKHLPSRWSPWSSTLEW